MRRIGLFVGFALAATAAPLSGQCTTGTSDAQALCRRAVDAVKTLHPLAGAAISGGNPELGAGGTLGGLGHFFVSARVNVVQFAVPSPDTTKTAPAKGGVPAPVIEAGIGLFPGIGNGLLSVDALASATLLPTTQVADLSVDSGAAKIGKLALGLGYGLRVGVLKGSFFIPSVSVSVMRRSLPRLRYGQLGSAPGSGDAFSFDTDLQATNVRVMAGMHLLLLDVAAGFGLDHYSSTAHLTYYDPLVAKTDTLPLSNNRQVVFLNAGVNLMLVKIVGEIGYQTGKDQKLSTNYTGFDPKAGHVFGGAGVRISF